MTDLTGWSIPSRFADGVPLKGIRAEHLANGLILPSHLSPSVFGLVGNVTTIDPDDTAAAGTSGLVSDAAHQHVYTTSAPASLTQTATNTEGSGTTHVRDDHGHATHNLPWGEIAKITLDTSSSAFTADSDTDLLLNNVSVRQGKRYAIHFHAQTELSAAGLWNINLKLNTTVIDHFVTVGQFGTASFMFDATVYWTAPTTQATDDFVVFADEVSGAGNLTMTASATSLRYLEIIDVGVAV